MHLNLWGQVRESFPEEAIFERGDLEAHLGTKRTIFAHVLTIRWRSKAGKEGKGQGHKGL